MCMCVCSINGAIMTQYIFRISDAIKTRTYSIGGTIMTHYISISGTVMTHNSIIAAAMTTVPVPY